MVPNFRFPSSLEVLTLKDFTFSWTPWIPDTAVLSKSDPALESLEGLSNIEIFELKGVKHAWRWLALLKSSHSATLNKLILNDCSVDLFELMDLFESGPLSTLTFLATSNPGLNDDHMQRIATECTLLEHVELCGMKITGCAVKELCTRTAIKTLQLSSCPDISPDAITWARDQGVRVIVYHTDESRRSSGRAVRYG